MEAISQRISSEVSVISHQFTKEEDYWLKKLSGQLLKIGFPHDRKTVMPHEPIGTDAKFRITDSSFSMLMNICGGSDIKLFMILTALLVVLLNKYSGSKDIIVGAPIFKQDTDAEFVNTIVALRNHVTDHLTFKELLLHVRETILEADEYQNYSIELLLQKLKLPYSGNDFPLFDVAILLENIHDKKYIQHIHPNMIFSFSKTESEVQGVVEYNSVLYKKTSIKSILGHYCQLLQGVLIDLNTPLSQVDIITEAEKKRLLVDFNDNQKMNRFSQPIHELFEKQVKNFPENIVVAGTDMTYRELNKRANQLGHLLRKKGTTTESVLGIMLEPSVDMLVGLMGILKAGGAYLPIDPGLPEERVRYMLEDSGAAALISTNQAIEGKSFTALQGFEGKQGIRVTVTPPRPHIAGFDRLPRPNRRLINLQNYKNKIGMASVTNCISFQATRGCPYHCLFCHKIWSKHHVYRSAEKIYCEIEHYYQQGVTNFAFIDDCFNLNIEKSRRVFQLIVENKLEVQLFFPNGLRGDIMTPDYIDLMVEAGTRGINLSLESASPRFQKLLRKYLNLDKFKEVMDYISTRHPNVILEMASMHGFPTETEEEAMMTLDFIKSIKWLHFPYIHILKIFPNTEMEAFALEHGVCKKDILVSRNRAFHELPETLPFPKSFTRKYQANFLNDYFLDKERLLHVLPHQMKVLSETALVQKYNAYLPVEIETIQDLIEFARLDELQVLEDYINQQEKEESKTLFNLGPEIPPAKPDAKKILLLDLSQHFSSHSMLYRVVEQPLGLISLLTYLKERFADEIDGRIYKSGNDFDSFQELKVLIEDFKPDLVGLRTLTFFKEFFHEAAAFLRQWGVGAPIITGGPYASSDYNTILKDSNIDLVVLGEGEYTLAELIEKMLANDFLLPGPEVLGGIKGIAFRHNTPALVQSREILLLDRLDDAMVTENCENPAPAASDANLAYVMYTSGSTGKPKGVMVEHRQVNNCISWMQDKFNLDQNAVIVNRTDLTFDPSVWEIFWPLYIGGSVKILDTYQRKDAEFLIRLMAEDTGLTMMYCPATLVNIMTYLLDTKTQKPRLKLPWLIIGAEPITMGVVKNFYKYFAGKIVNTYGPTECTINNTYYDLDRCDERSIVPIGTPVHNNNIYILDQNLRPVPLKMAGEICIAGNSVSRGYINNWEKTTGAFVKNPFGSGKLLKTGDIGRWLEDGNIEIMGRIDEQVKIRGHRIELGEIETVLSTHPAVSECVTVVLDNRESAKNVKKCKTCGITTCYPSVTINMDNVCNICEFYSKNKKYIDNYFKIPEQLKQFIHEANKSQKSKYDCLLLYAGGRGAGYAMYQLVDMGFNVLALTYDNGYFSKTQLENIKSITSSVGVDHVVLTHKNSDKILAESIKVAATVCRGCFHTSASLAGEYAYKHDIPVVVGATLSRGQIIENRMFMFLQQGITNEKDIENEILNLQKGAPEMDKSIYAYIDIDLIKNGAVHDKVKFVDFFRYFDITNQEMITYLDNRDPYWKGRKTFSVYSTNCPIKQMGDYSHQMGKGYHYYGGASSWEKRLGHLTLENLQEDLNVKVTETGYENFLKGIGVRQNKPSETSDKYLCTYFVPRQAGENNRSLVAELRDYLSKQLPPYMIPNYFLPLDRIPLTSNGKVDKKALPEPRRTPSTGNITYVPPKTNMEKLIAAIWQEVLKMDRVGTRDNFFDLGGSSLDIVIVGSKLKEKLQKDTPTVTLFTYPTINSLAAHLLQEETTHHPSHKQKERSSQLKKGQNRLKQSLEIRRGRI
ncbi:MAG: AMP-binding protein [Candidatus Aminicenantes bacterium]|nr:MAG: AMP-binding protein [Candidatus Aminicenantes bacterium]